MAAFTAQLKPFNLLMVCVTLISTLAVLAAGLQPPQAAAVRTPAAQAVPVAPAAAVFQRPTASASTLAAAPQPKPVPAAPAVPLAENPPPAEQALRVPPAGSFQPLLVLVFAGGLLAAVAVTWRHASSRLRTAAC